ncbi:MAG: DMT family transporter, partial [Rhodocyclaceae bacterium]|nr:DMT family transporter [Rhodocyclaceae bacterium]
MERKVKLATLGALTGNSIFGFSFMFSRMALGVAAPFVMLMHRFILASLLLGAIAFVCARRGFERDENGEIHWLRFSLRGKPVAPLLALGMVQPVAYFLCESYGISMTNATFSGVIIALVPIVALAAGALVLGEIPSRAQVAWSLLSIGGVVLMTLQQSADGVIRPLGVVMLLGAVVSGVAFNILSRRMSSQFSALERTTVMMAVAAVVFALLAAVQCRGDFAQMLAPLASGTFLTAIVYLSVLSSIMAFLFINFASNTLPVAKTTAFCNLTTAISMFAGVVFLGEPFGVISLAASAMIILGVWKVQA